MSEKPVYSFRVSDSDLAQDQAIYNAFEDYQNKRSALATAFKEHREAIAVLEPLLGPVLPQEHLVKGKRWKLKEDMDTQEGGLVIEVYANEAKRGKKKAELPSARLNITRPTQGSQKPNKAA